MEHGHVSAHFCFPIKRDIATWVIIHVYTPTKVIDCLIMLTRLASDKVLDAAYDWLCHRRRKYPANNDVWTLRGSVRANQLETGNLIP
jgi:hypothetical protein